MARILLDTSFVSACVTTREDPASTYRRDASRSWMATQAAHHQVFVSAEVAQELADPEYPQRVEGLRFIQDLPHLELTSEVAGLAKLLVRERLMPAPASGDAVHVAVACVHRVGYILSWNVRHLANPNKTRHLQVICVRAGYLPPRIVTPDFLWESST